MANLLTTYSPAQTDVSDWKYISEGRSTIVFSYIGAPHPTFSEMVLRVRKAPIEQTGSDANRDERGGEDEPDDLSIDFQNRVISQLVPRIHLPVLESVRVERKWLERLSAAVDGKQPEARRKKDTIDVGRRKAVVATDLVGGKGWAVEIKASELRKGASTITLLNAFHVDSLNGHFYPIPPISPWRRKKPNSATAGSACTHTRKFGQEKPLRWATVLWTCSRASASACRKPCRIYGRPGFRVTAVSTT